MTKTDAGQTRQLLPLARSNIYITREPASKSSLYDFFVISPASECVRFRSDPGRDGKWNQDADDNDAGNDQDSSVNIVSCDARRINLSCRVSIGSHTDCQSAGRNKIRRKAQRCHKVRLALQLHDSAPDVAWFVCELERGA